MKSLLRRLPRSKSKSRRTGNTTTTSSTEVQNTKQDDLRVPKIDPADLKVQRNSVMFSVSPASRMVGKVWNLTKVTVREKASQSELQNLCRVSHPHILLLMGVSEDQDLGLQLVFQHVALGSLHHWLHVQVREQSRYIYFVSGIVEGPTQGYGAR